MKYLLYQKKDIRYRHTNHKKLNKFMGFTSIFAAYFQNTSMSEFILFMCAVIIAVFIACIADYNK